jgi:hypothetical protein
MLSDEGAYAGLNERFEVCVVDGGEGEVEDVEGDGADGGEVAVEEDEV